MTEKLTFLGLIFSELVPVQKIISEQLLAMLKQTIKKSNSVQPIVKTMTSWERIQKEQIELVALQQL